MIVVLAVTISKYTSHTSLVLDDEVTILILDVVGPANFINEIGTTVNEVGLVNILEGV